ncbi:MAG TPA: penicillin-binding protein A [Candidatus Oscillibacter excrementigallinarum]|uniref:Penicillin-binding protein A n=1 Tax=Candidatus Oscillibacter excrementigallinarum TaxID=2838716 RepID=A0A9D2RSW7_9FIRM|nr:penicillin-binding protein A [Candidatus Oscillibacter excrementigallinarum]
MDHKDARHLRLYVLAALFFAVMAVYLGVLFNTQVNHYDEYYASSIRTIARSEAVEAARGNITDRNGKLMVSSRSSYNLTFDASLLDEGEDANEAILRLLELCQERGINWVDALPITRSTPFAYTLDSLDSTSSRRFLTYLKDLDGAAEALGAYLLEHPALLETTDEDGDVENPADDILADEELTDAQKASRLLDELTASQLTAALLEGAGLSPTRLIALMREDLNVPASFSVAEARLVLGIQYEIRSRNLVSTDAYVLAEDIDTELISLLNDGDYAGAKITPSSVREYETTYAAHILGYLGDITAEDDYWNTLYYEGYAMNDKIGRSGVEAAFEEYLRGTDGVRVVSTNEEGKITGEYYSTEPVPGNTVELTIDLDLQQATEDALAATITQMNAEDGDESRGGAAVVLDVDTREVLAIASYPTYDLATFRQSASVYAALESDPSRPFNNRATQGLYVPGSTIKPLTAVAALEEEIITATERLRSPSHWSYPNDPTGSGINCAGGNHGLINVTQAITRSCNYFFAEMGYRLGMDTYLEYLHAFGLGDSTGIEIGDAAGILPENPEGQDRAPWAAFGQGNQAYTPLQIANYIATLVSGGELLQPHLLKAIKSYDNAEVLTVGEADTLGTVSISDSTLEAVKEGMLGYTQPGGSVYNAFRSCVVTAGAKTGTSQLGGDQTDNGVFVCFAPYDDPEIAVAIVIEHATWGSNLASTGVEILNSYFAADDSGNAVTGENQLLP